MQKKLNTIEWILERIEEGLSNRYYKKKYVRKNTVEALYLCDQCDIVWSIGKESYFLIAHYYQDLPRYGKDKKKCPHCAQKSGVSK